MSNSSFRQIRQSSIRHANRSTSKSHNISSIGGSTRVASSQVSLPPQTADVSAVFEPSVAPGAPDTRDGVVELTKNAKYCVTRLPAFPGFLKGAQLESYGEVDQNTKYALTVSDGTTYVWSYSSPDHVPNTLSFPPPENTKYAPLATLVQPIPGSKEPGMVMISVDTGLLTYWEAVGGAVADGLLHRRKSIEHKVGLYAGEIIEHFVNVEPAGVVATTSSGRFILITLRDSKGKAALRSGTMLGGGSGILSTIKGAISLAGSRRDIVSVKPGVVTGRNERQVMFINKEGDLSVWDCSRTGSTRLLIDERLKEIMLNYIVSLYQDAGDTFTVHDVEVLEDEATLFILTSFVHDAQAEEVYYIIYTLSTANRDIKVTSAHRIQSFTSYSTQRPRLLFPNPSATLFAVFSHGVVLIEAMPEKMQEKNIIQRRWEDVITFRHEVEIQAAGVEDVDIINGKTVRNCGVVLIAHNAGIIRVERFEDEQKPLEKRALELEPELAKTRIEQAVFYGYNVDDENNPLDFEARKEDSFNQSVLENAFLEVSKEILSTSSIYMPPMMPSLSEHLQLRVTYLQRLGRFLNANYGDSLTIGTRQQLLWDLEKAVVAKNLWAHVDAKLHDSNENQYQTANVLVAVINHKSKASVGDPLREWFLQNVAILSKLLIACSKFSSKVVSGSKDVDVLVDANIVLLEAIYSSALGVRNDWAGPTYRLKPDDASETAPWTSSVDLIKAFESQYSQTRTAVHQLAKDDQFAPILGDQLLCIVETLCALYTQRLTWIQNSSSADKDEGTHLSRDYNEKRGGWLRQLVDIGHKEGAIKIADTFRIYRSLVEILVQDWRLNIAAGREDDSEKYLELINYYMTKFGFDFAAVLYEYFIETKQLKALLTLFPDHQDYLTRFFEGKRYPRISWVQDVNLQNYADAANALIEASSGEDMSVNTRLRLSLAKLNVFSSVDSPENLPTSMLSTLKNIDSRLELCSFQESLTTQLKSQLGIENVTKADTHFQRLIGGLRSRGTEGLVQVLQRGLTRLLQGRSVTIEELVDVLTLVDIDVQDAKLNFYRALKLVRDSTLSDTRKSLNEYLIWRRLIFADSWEKIVNTKSKSDEKIQNATKSTVLYHTLEALLKNDDMSSSSARYVVDPSSLCGKGSSFASLQSERYPYANEKLLKEIKSDLEKEDETLQKMIKDFHLESWMKGIYQRVQSASGTGQTLSGVVNQMTVLAPPEPMDLS
ncbi:hypothetical protein TRVA0_002S00980 [Trichomonascus vanleenenianus]|uniref:Nup133p n=1 Tax=Trichomonascus vanleenenianus TaxID=2268995 RepID=UPI003EC9D64C